jgi:hypothetical protein
MQNFAKENVLQSETNTHACGVKLKQYFTNMQGKTIDWSLK